MAFSSLPWPFRWRRAAGPSKSAPSAAAAAAAAADEDEDDELGVTPPLVEFLRSLSADTFKSCALQLQGGSDEAATSDLTHWQERHAVLVLSKSKEISKIRYDLCPRHMKDNQFWRLYFHLARSYIAQYELCAIQKEKLKRMETADRRPKDAITIEVEMQESKCRSASPTLPIDSGSQDL